MKERNCSPIHDAMTVYDYVMRSDTYFWGNAIMRCVMAVVIVTGASRLTSPLETTSLILLADIRSAQGYWPGSYLVPAWDV